MLFAMLDVFDEEKDSFPTWARAYHRSRAALRLLLV